MKNTISGLCLQRHPNDIKLFKGSLPSFLEQTFKNYDSTCDENLHWRNAFDFTAKSEHSDYDKPFQNMNPSQAPLRRPTGLHRPNPKYYNNYFETDLQS